MKIVILCGGQGTRIREVSDMLPKPMLPVGGKPMLWHIMKIYAHYGFNDFVLCLGYKGWLIKEFFLNYQAQTSDLSLRLGDKNSIQYYAKSGESDWRVTLVDTGDESQTGERLARVKSYLREEEVFGVTYGDGVADINIRQSLNQHRKSKLAATVTGVKPLGRFGEITAQGNKIVSFDEKPHVSSGLINGGFMFLNQSVLNKYIGKKVNESLEKDVLPRMIKAGVVGVYKHPGEWQCVDTPREYSLLNHLWDHNQAFWKIW